MQTLGRSIFVVLFVSLSAAHVRADAPSRAARLLTLGGDIVAVLVASDRAWAPDGGGEPLALCAGDRCAPVARVERCSVPQCPGEGIVAIAERSVADVGGFPTDREGFGREVDRLRADAALATLSGSFGVHPEPPPPPPQPPEPARFLVDSHRGISWELDFVGIAGGLGVADVPLAGGEIAGGFRYTWEPHGGDDEFLMILLGSSIGADLRVRTLAFLPAQGPGVWGVSIGIAPSLGIAPEGEGFRLPSAYGSLLPEFGVIFGEDMAPAWYAGWTLPFAVLLDVHFGIELRATVLVIDDWRAGDDVEALLTFGAGFIVR